MMHCIKKKGELRTCSYSDLVDAFVEFCKKMNIVIKDDVSPGYEHNEIYYILSSLDGRNLLDKDEFEQFVVTVKERLIGTDEA